MKKIVVVCFMMIALLITEVTVYGYNQAEVTGDMDVILSDRTLEFLKYGFLTDWEGKDAVGLYYQYTNNSDEGQMAMADAYWELYQDGRSLDTTFLNSSESEYELFSNSTEKIKDGASVPVVFVYELRNKSSKIDIDITNFETFEKQKASIEISLNTGGQDTADTKAVEEISENEETASTTGKGEGVTVHVTKNDDGTIATLTIDTPNETPGIGSKANEDPSFAEQFVGKAGPFTYGENGVEAISGATLTSNAVLEALNSLYQVEAVTEEAGSEVTPAAAEGEETASATGMGEGVTVHVTKNDDGTIASLTIDTPNETPGIGSVASEDASFAEQFLGKAGPFTYGEDGIEAISGATLTSNAVLEALNTIYTRKLDIELNTVEDELDDNSIEIEVNSEDQNIVEVLNAAYAKIDELEKENSILNSQIEEMTTLLSEDTTKAETGSKEIIVYDNSSLSGLSYEELVALKDQINLAIWNSEEWQEVEVPQGVWEVGEDIPVGKWEIKALPEAITYITYGTELKNGGTDVKTKSYQSITDASYRGYDSKRDVTSWVIDLDYGSYLQIEFGPAVFTPYNGKTSLGFK